MYETVHVIPRRQLPPLLEEVKRQYQVWIAILAVAALGLGASTVALHGRLQLADADAYDAVYESVMREYDAVRDDPHLRRYLIAKIMSLAAEHEVNPDLLFSVVAVESSFRVVAKSPKNARGLGQLMFATARAFNPGAVSRPDDLYDVHLNLETALKYLKANLAQNRDDMRTSLMVYYYGDTGRRPGFQDTDQYARKVMDFYNLLQDRRQAVDVTAAVIFEESHHLSG
ncbi:MAG: lytic transglycosylase domain-containing protein [Candidatus Methylomirabilis oxyfera]|nr:lytic transglycosylase domain-containing protein [Candidatus Methylomirabilis oxyfera]